MADALVRDDVGDRGLRTGQPVVFAHGFGCDRAMWRLVAPASEADHRIADGVVERVLAFQDGLLRDDIALVVLRA